MNTVMTPGGGGVGVQFETVTVRVAVVVRPAPSLTVRPSVWEPSLAVVVLHEYVAVVAGPDVVETCVPSRRSVKLIGVPLAPVSDIPTLTVPLTVAPSAGLVNEAPRGGGVPPPAFWTLNVRVAVPLLALASRTAAVSVCGPLATRVESQGSVTWLPPVPEAS